MFSTRGAMSSIRLSRVIDSRMSPVSGGVMILPLRTIMNVAPEPSAT